jgi:hypothetical protein
LELVTNSTSYPRHHYTDVLGNILLKATSQILSSVSILVALPETVGLICTRTTKLMFPKKCQAVRATDVPRFKLVSTKEEITVHIPFPSVLNIWLIGTSDVAFVNELNSIGYSHRSRIEDCTTKSSARKQRPNKRNIPTIRKRRSSSSSTSSIVERVKEMRLAPMKVRLLAEVFISVVSTKLVVMKCRNVSELMRARCL